MLRALRRVSEGVRIDLQTNIKYLGAAITTWQPRGGRRKRQTAHRVPFAHPDLWLQRFTDADAYQDKAAYRAHEELGDVIMIRRKDWRSRPTT